MTIVYYLSFIFLNFLYSLRKKRSNLLAISTIIFIYFLFIGYRNEGINASHDLLNYITNYTRVGMEGYYDTLEVGYLTLMRIGNTSGFDFYTFKAIVLALCFPIIVISVKRYSRDYHSILVLYMLYLAIIDTEHFRNFIALSIFLYSIKFLEGSLFKHRWKYLFLILLASTIHNAFLFYFLFIFANTKIKNRSAKVVAIFSILLSIIIFLNNNNVPFFGSIISYFDNEKMYSYATTKTRYGFVLPFGLQIISFLIVLWARKILLGGNYTSLKSQEIRFIQLVFWINTLAFAFFPLFMMSLTFYRLSRNLLILNLIVVSKVRSLQDRRFTTKVIFPLTAVLSLVMWLTFDLIYKTPANRVLIPFFTENYFFN